MNGVHRARLLFASERQWKYEIVACRSLAFRLFFSGVFNFTRCNSSLEPSTFQKWKSTTKNWAKKQNNNKKNAKRKSRKMKLNYLLLLRAGRHPNIVRHKFAQFRGLLKTKNLNQPMITFCFDWNFRSKSIFSLFHGIFFCCYDWNCHSCGVWYIWFSNSQ